MIADLVVREFRDRLHRELGDELVGLYLYGSLAFGDFDADRSDVDLIAAVASPVGQRRLAALARLHAAVARAYPEWDDRIEVAYVPIIGLRTFKSRTSTVAIIEPGEPLRLKRIGRQGMIHYYLVREHGITLLGPSPRTLIDEISAEEFVDAVRAYLARWREPLAAGATRAAQRYAVLTMCRGLYSLAHSRPTSKNTAARWAQKAFPEWAATIERALASPDGVPAGRAEQQETAEFVAFALGIAQTCPC
jgi:Aminoglycoside adenylyltransferase, C-terminal domain/Nucleotidyltransferase domain